MPTASISSRIFAAIIPQRPTSCTVRPPQPRVRLAHLDACSTFGEELHQIVGGPDDGRRIRILLPQSNEENAYLRRIFNGTIVAFERCQGQRMRPSFGVVQPACRDLALPTILAVAEILSTRLGMPVGLHPDSLPGLARARLLLLRSTDLAAIVGVSPDSAERLRQDISTGDCPCPAVLAAHLLAQGG